MKEKLTLKDLRPGEKAKVEALECRGSIRRRMLDMGFAAGSLVECLGRSPGGDPAAYRIRGTVIALRREDSADIIIKRVEEVADEA